MTDTIPDAVYEAAAAAEGPGPQRNGRPAHRAPVHDADLEHLIAHVAVEFPDRVPQLLEHGLDPAHVHQRGPRHIVAAVLDEHRAGRPIDRYTIRGRLPADHADQWLAQVLGREVPTLDAGRLGAWVSELRRLHTARHTDDILDRATRARDQGLPLEHLQEILAELHQLDAGPGDQPTTATSWRPIDMADALRGEGPPAADLWHHHRGHCLLYAGRTHAFFGASESLKSWAAQAAAAEVLTGGGHVLYIDYEDDQEGVAARLTALGVPADVILDRLAYIRPDEPLMDQRDAYTRGGLDFHETLTSRSWQLAVIDGMTDAMTTEALDVNDNADAARFQRRLMRPIADTGAAALAIDHQPKNAGESGRYAIGAQHKLAGLTGAAYRFEAQRPLGRPDGAEPSTGTTKITVSKDRPGYIRGKSPDGVAGILRVTSWPDLRVDVDLVDPADLGDAGADMELAGRILTHLATYDGASANQLELGVQGKAAAIRSTTTWLVGKHWIDVRKEGQAHRHYLTPAGQKELPDA